MLFITRHNEPCCCTCKHWNGVRVSEDDGQVYSLSDVEGVCKPQWDMIDADKTCTPLTLPSDAACQHWELKEHSERVSPLAGLAPHPPSPDACGNRP